MSAATYRISPRPRSIGEEVRELAASGDLFRLLLAREIRTRYRQTGLGIAWVILQPLVPALIFAAVFGSFGRLPSGGTPYILFALSGLVIFGLFSNVAARASTAFIRDSQLVSKVYFPRAVLPLAAGAAALADFVVGFALVIVLSLAAGQAPSLTLAAVPLVALAALVLGLAVGLAVSALSAHFRDFVIAVPFALQVAMYASPVVYSSELVPEEFRNLYALNPLVAVTDSFRAVTIGTAPTPVPELALATAIGAIVTLVAIMIYSRASRDLADVL